MNRMDSIIIGVEDIDVVGNKLDLRGVLRAEKIITDKDLETIINLLKRRHDIDCINLSSNFLGEHRYIIIEELIKNRSDLRTLDISNNSLERTEHWNCISRALKGSMFLTDLNISNNSINDEGMHFLCAALRLNLSLTKLSLRYTKLTETSLECLAKLMRCNPNVVHLDLYGSTLNSMASLPLIQALAYNHTITYLDFGCQQVTFQHGDRSLLYETLGSIRSIKTLKLENNSMQDYSVTVLIKELLSSRASITNLDLTRNFIGFKGVPAIATLIEECPSLTKLNISSSLLDQRALERLEAAVSRSRSLLNIKMCDLTKTDDGAFTLFRENASLTKLDFSGYSFKNIPAFVARSFLELKHIKKLHLQRCVVGNCIAVIGQVLMKSPIEDLDLESNFLTVGSSDIIATLLKQTKTLRKLNIARNFLDEPDLVKIIEGLTANNTLTTLNINYNSLKNLGSTRLHQALAANMTLKTLFAVSTDFEIDAVKQLIETNKSLTTLDIRFNYHADTDYTIILQGLRSNRSLTHISWVHNHLNIHRGYAPSRLFPSMMNEGERLLFENKRRKLFANKVLIISQTILLSANRGPFSLVPPEVFEQILLFCGCLYFTKKQIGIICTFAADRSFPVNTYALYRAL